MNQRYKGRESRSLATIILLHQLASCLYSSSSTMADLPDEQDYYVFTSEFYGTKQPISLTFDEDEGIIRAMPGKKTAWTVEYIDREKGIYKVIHPESGLHAAIPEDSDGLGCHVEEPQHWKFNKTEGGFSASRIVNGEELFLHLDSEGRLTASPTSKLKEIQSWVLQPVNAV
ncbi:hypothetical protein K503DRAFT_38396 [Rhizopogon vinicolor AM-OR11-026]|uniref:Ricin B lectin domain-containing protein n=1 Tax=Rhizopogon vinicolor AM-OR11-026 TaxID=1314800 RepID=A0A1B7MH15_9AGAM|nr:hypothetical protein K503DRAFT_38396 [Rhizopogon vinicolor AM-OR11-026]